MALAGLPVEFETPIALAAFPVLVAALWFLVVRGSEASETDRRIRLGLFGSRLVIVGLLVTAAAGPYTMAERETPGDPRVTVLVDESASMAVGQSVAGQIESGVEEQGVPASTVTIAAGNRSAIGDGIAANLEPGGSLVVVSDGHVTEGRSLDSVAELARSVNATISTVAFDADRRERYVRVVGGAKTTTGVENRYLVRVGGASPGTNEVTVAVDGERVARETVEGEGAFEFVHTFEETGSHRITARIDGGDVYAVNDVAYRSVRVVRQPRVLYVSRRDAPLRAYLAQLYNVTATATVPSDLSPYYAVVIHDLPAGELGDVDALQRYVIDGNGLVVVGGEHAYDRGNYSESTIGSMLPVRMGAGQGERAAIVLAIDVSGSATEGMRIQKALALDVLDQLGDQHLVGIVAFNDQAYRVADLSPLRSSRAVFEDRIRRLQAGGQTRIDAGLAGASRLLGERDGTVILLSDGRDEPRVPIATARRLGERNQRVVSVGVGRVINAGVLRALATVSGGTYYRANETSRLRILFGDQSRQFSGSGLTIVDGTHFITAGVRTEAELSESNEVSVKNGAKFLVATGVGSPAVSVWRYGLGRVVSVTAYDSGGGLGGLLSPPDSLLLSKSVNWAIGDPERKATGIIGVDDTRVGRPTTVTYTGGARPQVERISFNQVGPDTYRATVVPSSTGFHSVLDAEYAANYPEEYGGFGPDPALRRAVERSGGRVFEPNEASAIAAFAERQSTRLREVRDEWDWVLLLVALVVFLGEVAFRRLRTYRGSNVP